WLVGEKHIVKNYGVYDSFEKIDFNKLPNEFVLKTTHDSGGVVICKNKRDFNYKEAKNKLGKHLGRTPYYLMRGWPYKHIQPRIIAEEYLHNEKDIELKDYKFFCFNGQAKLLYIATERHTKDVKFNFYDINFKPLE